MTLFNDILECIDKLFVKYNCQNRDLKTLCLHLLFCVLNNEVNCNTIVMQLLMRFMAKAHKVTFESDFTKLKLFQINLSLIFGNRISDKLSEGIPGFFHSRTIQRYRPPVSVKCGVDSCEVKRLFEFGMPIVCLILL